MKNLIRGLSLLGLSALTLVALSGCETSEDRSLASAQSCLDGASTEAQANQCIAMVQGLTTPESYLIRCSAHFVAQGFTGQKIADAFDTLNNDSNNTDPMVPLMSFLKFDSTMTAHTASKTVTDCQASGVRSMLRLATTANLATSVNDIAIQIAGSVGSIPGYTGTDATADMQAIVDYMSSLDNTQLPTQEASEIGNVAISMNSAFCNSGSAYASEDICVDLGDALAAGSGTDAEAIGRYLLGLIDSTP